MQLLGLGPFKNTEMYANIDIEAPTTYPFPNYQIWNGTFNGASSAVWRNGNLLASGYAGGAEHPASPSAVSAAPGSDGYLSATRSSPRSSSTTGR